MGEGSKQQKLHSCVNYLTILMKALWYNKNKRHRQLSTSTPENLQSLTAKRVSRRSLQQKQHQQIHKYQTRPDTNSQSVAK